MLFMAREGEQMARVNLEEKFFAESNYYMALGNRMVAFISPKSAVWLRWAAMGCLADMWHKSQSQLAVTCTIDDLMDWLAVEKEIAEQLAQSLCRTKYLRDLENGSFEIAGNEVQIEHRVEAGIRGKKGGEATRQRWEKIKSSRKPKALSIASSIAPSMAPSMADATLDARANATLGASPIQNNTKQYKTEQNIYSELAARWLEFTRSQAPHLKLTQAAFEEGIDYVCRNVPLTLDQITAVFEFASNDDFWRPNVLSPKAMMKKSDKTGLRKIDTLLLKLKQSQKPRYGMSESQRAKSIAMMEEINRKDPNWKEVGK